MELERICVVGSSGAGKSTFARRCAEALGCAHLELDGVMHQPGWVRLDDEAARARIDAFTSTHERWIVDGNYASFRGLVWARADAVVWLDLERHVVVRSVLWRSLRRLVTREVLWNGNQERWSNMLSLDPERSVVAWSWARFADYRREYARLMRSPEWSHLQWVRVRSRRDANRLLARVARARRLVLERADESASQRA